MSPLDELADATADYERSRDRWRGAIVAAVQAGEPIARIARVAGITRPTVYAMRDALAAEKDRDDPGRYP